MVLCTCFWVIDFVATMSKRHILMDPTQPSTSKRSKPPSSTNWDICILCQVTTGEPLQCPLRSTKQSAGSGYASLTEDLLRFQTLHRMPMDINFERLDDGTGIESTLRAHRAEWHKKCRLQFNKKAFDEQSRRELATGQQFECASSMQTRSAHSHPQSTEPTCFFCNEPAGSAGLHMASTYNIDANMRRCALEVKDTALLAKLAAGDMIAIEAMYHSNCLCSLYNRARQDTPEDNDDFCLHGIAFAELVAFLEDMRSDQESAPIFKLTDIAQLYKVRLEAFTHSSNKLTVKTALVFKLCSDPGNFWPCYHPASECSRIPSQSNGPTKTFHHCIVLLMALVKCHGRELVSGFVHHKFS